MDLSNGRRTVGDWLEALEGRAMLSAGQLDPSFGTGGTTATVYDGGATSDAAAVTVLRDGRILVAGTSSPGGTSSVVTLARYLPDGTPDAAFGTDGQASSTYGFASAMAVQRDGRVIVAGGDSYLLVERFLPDGHIDETFHPGGQEGPGIARVRPLTDLDWTLVDAVVVRPDGRILVAARFQRTTAEPPVPHEARYQAALVQLLPDGEFDPSFGTGGVMTMGTDRGDGAVIFSALLLQDDGAVLAAGGVGGDFLLARVTPEGKLDDSFASGGGTAGGIARVDFGTPSDAARALVRLRDGRIAVVGNAGDDVAIARFLPSGRADRTLGRYGRAVIEAGRHTAFHVSTAHLGARGRVVVGGTLSEGGAPLGSRPSEAATLRLTPDGGVDTGYGRRGWARVPQLPPGVRVTGVAPDSGGGVVLTGLTYSYGPQDLLLARITPAGETDESFGANAVAGDAGHVPGVVRTSTRGPAGVTLYDTIVLRNGKILAVGDRRASDGGSPGTSGPFLLARWNADGTPDETFGVHGQRVGFEVVPTNARLYEQRHGNVLMVFDTANGVGLARIGPDGTVYLLTPGAATLAPPMPVADSALDAQGRVLAVGGRRLVRVLTDRVALDEDFGRAAGVDLPFEATAVLALPDGTVVAAGILPDDPDAPNTPVQGRAMVARFLPDGQPDLTFGYHGVLRIPAAPGAGPDESVRLAVQEGGRVVVAFSRQDGQTPVGSGRVGMVFGITAAGSADPTFGGTAGQPLRLPTTAGFGIKRIVVDPESRVLVLAMPDTTTTPGYGVPDTSLTRLTVDGLPDPSYGGDGDGAAVTDFDPGSETPVAVALQEDGRAVVAGCDYAGGVFLGRYLGDPLTARVVARTLRITATDRDAPARVVVHTSGSTLRVEGIPRAFDVRTFSAVRVVTGAGDDLVDLTSLALPARVVAGAGDDLVLGGSAADLIDAGPGADSLFGGAGEDTLHGGDGDDYLNGGPDSDQVFGEAGNDQIFAADRYRDYLDGGIGFDRVAADADDVLSGVEGLLA